jgi:hypothetical protein
MLYAELKTLGAPPLPTVDTNSDFFMDNVWGEHRNLQDVMPDEYKQKANEWRISLNIDDVATNISISTGHLGYIYPPNYVWYSHKDVSSDYTEVAELVTYLKAKAEIVHRWTNVRIKVLGFLDECKSLNEAVKLWPDVVTYIDRDDIQRLEVKREKSANQSRAAEALAELNTDELMGAAVIARLSGADV